MVIDLIQAAGSRLASSASLLWNTRRGIRGAAFSCQIVDDGYLGDEVFFPYLEILDTALFQKFQSRFSCNAAEDRLQIFDGNQIRVVP